MRRDLQGEVVGTAPPLTEVTIRSRGNAETSVAVIKILKDAPADRRGMRRSKRSTALTKGSKKKSSYIPREWTDYRNVVGLFLFLITDCSGENEKTDKFLVQLKGGWYMSRKASGSFKRIVGRVTWPSRFKVRTAKENRLTKVWA